MATMGQRRPTTVAMVWLFVTLLVMSDAAMPKGYLNVDAVLARAERDDGRPVTGKLQGNDNQREGGTGIDALNTVVSSPQGNAGAAKDASGVIWGKALARFKQSLTDLVQTRAQSNEDDVWWAPVEDKDKNEVYPQKYGPRSRYELADKTKQVGSSETIVDFTSLFPMVILFIVGATVTMAVMAMYYSDPQQEHLPNYSDRMMDRLNRLRARAHKITNGKLGAKNRKVEYLALRRGKGLSQDLPYMLMIELEMEHVRFHVYAREPEQCPIRSTTTNPTCSILSSSKPIHHPMMQVMENSLFDTVSAQLTSFGSSNSFAGYSAFGADDMMLLRKDVINPLIRQRIPAAVRENLNLREVLSRDVNEAAEAKAHNNWKKHEPEIISGTQLAYYLYRGHLAENENTGNHITMSKSSITMATEIRSHSMLQAFIGFAQSINRVLPCNSQETENNYVSLSWYDKYAELPLSINNNCSVPDGDPPKCVGLVAFVAGMARDIGDDEAELDGCPKANPKYGYNIVGSSRQFVPMLIDAIENHRDMRPRFSKCISSSKELMTCEPCFDALGDYAMQDKMFNALTEFTRYILIRGNDELKWTMGGELQYAVDGYGSLSGRNDAYSTGKITVAMQRSFPALSIFPCQASNATRFSAPLLNMAKVRADVKANTGKILFNEKLYIMWPNVLLKLMGITVEHLMRPTRVVHWSDFVAVDLGFPFDCSLGLTTAHKAVDMTYDIEDDKKSSEISKMRDLYDTIFDRDPRKVCQLKTETIDSSGALDDQDQ